MEAEGSQLIVLPEMWHPGYFSFDRYAEAAKDTPAMWEALSEMAAALGACLHAGSLVESDNGCLYNTSVLFGPDGAQIAKYRKMHLYGFNSREQQLLEPGEEVVVADTPLGRLGMAVCYDLRFPRAVPTHDRTRRRRLPGGFSVAASPRRSVEHAAASPSPRKPGIPVRMQRRRADCRRRGPVRTLRCHRSMGHTPWPHWATTPVSPTQKCNLETPKHPVIGSPPSPTAGYSATPTEDLVLRREDGTAFRYTAKRLILAGYTARDTQAVAAYIAKLEEEGIAPPDEVPSYFVLGGDRLTTSARLEVTTAASCGEVEFALLIDEGEIWVAAASDHTDRALEAIDIVASKQNCPKVLSPDVWRLGDVEDHWDELVFEARTPAGAGRAYPGRLGVNPSAASGADRSRKGTIRRCSARHRHLVGHGPGAGGLRIPRQLRSRAA